MNELFIVLAFGAIFSLFAFFAKFFQLQNANDDVPAHTPDDDDMQVVLDTVLHISVPDIVDQVGEAAGAEEVEGATEDLTPSFAIAHAPVARIEGGYQRHKADKGNYNSRGDLVGTNWGIAAPVAEEYFKRVVTRKDMETLAESVAMDIFKIKFWDEIHASEYPDQQLANLVYDGAVNHGVRWGVKLLQRSMGLKEDGVVGPVTLAALQAKDPEQVYYAYYTARKNFYHAIVANRPTQQVFLNGWMRRLAYYRHYLPEVVA
jgi:lysozyme family protein